MSQAIKLYIYFLSLLLIALLVTGCILHPVIGPGYTVSISMLDNVRLKNKDIDFLDQMILNEKFGNRHVSSSDKWECVHYDRELDDPQFQYLSKYKFVFVDYCYYFVQPLTDTKDITQFSFSVANTWKGQYPAIKQEIDRLAEIFYKELANRFGTENVQIKRRRTGPPF